MRLVDAGHRLAALTRIRLVTPSSLTCADPAIAMGSRRKSLPSTISIPINSPLSFSSAVTFGLSSTLFDSKVRENRMSPIFYFSGPDILTIRRWRHSGCYAGTSPLRKKKGEGESKWQEEHKPLSFQSYAS